MVSALTVASTACAMAGFGGALQLNVTDEQIRPLIIEVQGGAPDARLIEIDSTGEVEIGSGTARIDRYVIHRTTFGRNLAVGYFLCPKPCADPLASYLVAYSPDQLFDPDGELELRFRIVSAGGTQEIARSISAEMLADLWQTPTIEVGPTGG
jgi:hypothetical protein